MHHVPHKMETKSTHGRNLSTLVDNGRRRRVIEWIERAAIVGYFYEKGVLFRSYFDLYSGKCTIFIAAVRDNIRGQFFESQVDSKRQSLSPSLSLC